MRRQICDVLIPDSTIPVTIGGYLHVPVTGDAYDYYVMISGMIDGSERLVVYSYMGKSSGAGTSQMKGAVAGVVAPGVPGTNIARMFLCRSANMTAVTFTPNSASRLTATLFKGK